MRREVGLKRATSSPSSALLQRVLFFDKRLSKNNTIACVNCHLAGKGFADGMPASTGIKGLNGGRSAPVRSFTILVLSGLPIRSISVVSGDEECGRPRCFQAADVSRDCLHHSLHA